MRVDATLEKALLSKLGKRNRSKEPALTLDIYDDPDTRIVTATVRWIMNVNPTRRMALEDAFRILDSLSQMEIEYHNLALYGIAGFVDDQGKLFDLPAVRIEMPKLSVIESDWAASKTQRRLSEIATALFFHPKLKR